MIEELPEGSDWTSPIVLVKKSSGETRFCINYRRLNDVSIVGHHPIPYVEDALEGLAGFTAFHSLDLNPHTGKSACPNTHKESVHLSVQVTLYTPSRECLLVYKERQRLFNA